MKHLVITPYQNEEDLIEKTLLSVINQQCRPNLWVLVNDHSTDNSFQLVQKYAEKYSWIKNINSSTTNTKREEGSKIIQLVEEGIQTVQISDFDIFTKLDADISFDDTYFLKIKREFENDNNLALCGGKIYSKVDGEYIDEKNASYHVRGANKSYRVPILTETNCFKPIMGWDGLDEMILMYNGYHVKLIDIPVYQDRLTRERFNEIIFNYKNAYGKYKLGHSFLLSLLRSVKRMSNKPYVISGCAYLFGHIHAMLKNENKLIDKDIASFINTFHYRRIFNKS